VVDGTRRSGHAAVLDSPPRRPARGLRSSTSTLFHRAAALDERCWRPRSRPSPAACGCTFSPATSALDGSISPRASSLSSRATAALTMSTSRTAPTRGRRQTPAADSNTASDQSRSRIGKRHSVGEAGTVGRGQDQALGDRFGRAQRGRRQGRTGPSPRCCQDSTRTAGEPCGVTVERVRQHLDPQVGGNRHRGGERQHVDDRRDRARADQGGAGGAPLRVEPRAGAVKGSMGCRRRPGAGRRRRRCAPRQGWAGAPGRWGGGRAAPGGRDRRETAARGRGCLPRRPS